MVVPDFDDSEGNHLVIFICHNHFIAILVIAGLVKVDLGHRQILAQFPARLEAGAIRLVEHLSLLALELVNVRVIAIIGCG